MTSRVRRSRKPLEAGASAAGRSKRFAVGGDSGPGKAADVATQIVALQQELEATRAELRSVVGELESANGELAAYNAGLRSANLELEATNRSLTTANDELSARTAALIRANSEIEAARESLSAAKKIAEESSQAKSNFLARMSHELRTPLNAIIGFSDAIVSEVYGRLPHDRYRSYVTDIHASAVHLLGLISDVFDIAKIEAGKLRLHEAPVDVVALVSGAVGFVRPLASKARVTVVLDFEPPVAGLRVDPLRIRQVLLNVLSNAIKFSHRGGKVRVTVGAADARGLAIEIADRGVGIDPQILDNIGVEYLSAAQIAGREHEGTGLGLPVSIALMKAHGGELRVASRRGHGTAVTLRFAPDRVIPAAQRGAAERRPEAEGGAGVELGAIVASKS